MWLTKDEARFVDDLRQASREFEAVAVLVKTIERSLNISYGERSIIGDDADLRELKVVCVAAWFVGLDSDIAKHEASQ